LNSSEIQPYSNSSLIKINNSNISSAGHYSCKIAIQSGNGWTNISGANHNISVSPSLKFETNSSIKIKDDFIVNCTYNLSVFDEFNYLTIYKDNEEFYRLFNESIGIFQQFVFILKLFNVVYKLFFKILLWKISLELIQLKK
jgi:hypothetical protein